MSTFISEPGTRLGGRYRLEDRVSASTGWSAWKAIDEILARAVTVLTFAPGFPRITEVVTAARAAGRLTDARLAQVFDVEEDWDHAYVVMEWVGGDSLDDMLADGPLEPGLGTEIIEQGAEALASAHAAGVAHLCLNPGSLRWTPQSGVKVTGIGVDAALAGTTAEDPAQTDTFGLARLLYAALTAHWPGDEWPGLPPAPEVDGHARAPRQVRAGVPAAIDEVVCQALFQRPGAGGQPIATPAMLAAALSRVMPAPAAPPPAAPPPHFTQPSLTAGDATGPFGLPGPGGTGYWDDNGDPLYRLRDPLGRGRRSTPRTLIAAVTVLVVAALGVGGWTLMHHGGAGGGGPAQASHGPSTPGHPLGGVLKPVGAQGFDALSTPGQDPSNENTGQAKYAIDGKPATAWDTQWYASARFGNLKSGTGLLIDMGKAVRLSSVTVTFGAAPGANVRIEVGNSNARAASTLASFTTVARGSNLGGTHTFTAHGAATGRYVLIWFTKLPSNSSHQYEAEVFNVIVRGSS
jgi:hypothetical protein